MHSSPDATHWTHQVEHILAELGALPTDRWMGQHPDIVVAGGRAFIIYFVH